jgi:hypothetical protein
MARLLLSNYLPDDVIKIIQEYLLPPKSSYTFLEEIKNAKFYTICMICHKLYSSLSLKLLLNVNNFKNVEDLLYETYYCEKCYDIFINTSHIKKMIILNKHLKQ